MPSSTIVNYFPERTMTDAHGTTYTPFIEYTNGSEEGSAHVMVGFRCEKRARTDDESVELERLRAEFEAAGGRGVELAERIDELVALDDSQREPTYVYFNPSSDDEEGDSNVFVYLGEACDPADDMPGNFYSVWEG